MAATQTIYPHVFENADREVGGVLVGRMPADGGLPLITAAIPALSADEQRATLTFTQQAWAHVHRVLDSEFPPDEQIVGWYHSHPGFGIFLSGHDLFIHENFFSSPSQIAVVVDPIGRREGAFAWREGRLEALFEQSTPEPWRAAPPISREHDGLREHTVSTARAGAAADTASARAAFKILIAAGALAGCLLAVLAALVLSGMLSTPVPSHQGSKPRLHRAVRPTERKR